MRQTDVQYILRDCYVNMWVPNGDVICITSNLNFINNVIMNSVHVEDKKKGAKDWSLWNPAQDLHILESFTFRSWLSHGHSGPLPWVQNF